VYVTLLSSIYVPANLPILSPFEIHTGEFFINYPSEIKQHVYNGPLHVLFAEQAGNYYVIGLLIAFTESYISIQTRIDNAFIISFIIINIK
jgi:hypothetical protein